MELPPTVSDYWQKRRVWDRYREERDPVIGGILREQRRLTVAAVKDFARQRREKLVIADLGCGTGSIACDLMELDAVGTLLAVDINETALRKVADNAAQLGLQAKLRTLSGDFYDINWGPDESFDVILCMDALHHLPDIPTMLKGIRRRLRADGIFIGNLRAVESSDVFFGRYGILRRSLISIQPMVDRMLPATSPIRRWLGSIGYFRIRTFNRHEVERLLLDADFQILALDDGAYYWFSARKDDRRAGSLNPALEGREEGSATPLPSPLPGRGQGGRLKIED